MEKFTVDPSWTDKDSRVGKFRELYENHDFLTAYAAHTDLRVEADPHQAIGGEWETHGDLQRDFLVKHGLKPSDRLLDLGCGTGRLARKIVPYLDVGKYTGADISPRVLAHARQIGFSEGWAERLPEFVQIDTEDGTLRTMQCAEFDLIWSHSVWTHLPSEAIDALLGTLDAVMAPGARYLFTYKRGDGATRTGLKQWKYSESFLSDLAQPHGFQFTILPDIWPASQRTGMITRAT
jgi:SAM-dependent methyltransferase